VQHSGKLDRELGPKGLVVILMESQGSKLDELPAWFLRVIPTNRARVAASTSPPIQASANGIPRSALIGVDGTLLIEGLTGSIGQKLEKMLQAELDKIKTGWGGSATAKKARAALYGKGSPAAAKQVLAEATDKENAELEEIAKEIDVFVKSRRKSIDYLITEGRWVEAQEAATALAKGVKGMAEVEADVATTLQTFETPEGKKELALDKKTTPAIRALEEKKLKPADAAALRALVKGSEDTKVAARVLRTADALEASLKLKL
jgi:hypothetical protein